MAEGNYKDLFLVSIWRSVDSELNVNTFKNSQGL